ncbi:hypothetical protein MUN89_08845 [Halobacillus salinarum]|uniref:DUF4129 domain-containing protein n=1 Tax=Halobacillus salinarum TaxID=2932257 RepID=A0ABY4EPI5_9BACI|nr:hypothetical protein [Halobacillus salinarum]UOQ46006.1 hypothetical protein MUN89_08845 [Halobacillus salinarum]
MDRTFIGTSFYQYAGTLLMYYFFLYPLAVSLNGFNLPASSYLIIIIASYFLYGISLQKSRTYLPFLWTIPCLYLAGLWLGINAVLLLFVVPFTGWRFVIYYKNDQSNDNKLLLIVTAVIVFIELVLYPDPVLIFMAALQYVVLLVGHLYSHYVLTPKLITKKAGSKIGGLAGAAIFVSFIAIVLLKPIRVLLEEAWRTTAFSLLFLMKGSLGTLDKLGMDFSKEYENNEVKVSLEEGWKTGDMSVTNEEKMQQVASAFEWSTVLIITTCAIVILFLLVRMKKRSLNENLSPAAAEVIHTSFLESKSFSLSHSRRSKKPHDRIRAAFYGFERFAWNKGVGRHANETIEDWFHRTGLHSDRTKLYQKVRYGRKD